MHLKVNSTGYVMAFFELVKENNRFQTTHNQIIELREILKQNKEIYPFFNSKNIDLKEKFKLIDEVFKIYTKLLRTFLKVIVERNSASMLDEILKQYLKRSNEELKILYAKIYTAQPLELLELAKIKLKLEQKYRKRIELKNKINKDLISGFQILIGSEVIERNVSNDLERIKAYVLEEQEG